jgi:Lipase (class 3)
MKCHSYSRYTFLEAIFYKGNFMNPSINRKVLTLTAAISAAVLISGIASAAGSADSFAPTEKQAQQWRMVPKVGMTNLSTPSTLDLTPSAQPWKAGMFPVLFLTESKGSIGSDIARETWFAYDARNLPPERMSKVLVYADADSLSLKSTLALESIRLAKVSGWPIVLESKSGNRNALRSALVAAQLNIARLPKNVAAVSIEWRNGEALIRPTTSHDIESRLLTIIELPQVESGGFAAKFAHTPPQLPPKNSAFFAAAAFIDPDHVESNQPAIDHAHYSNPQSYINYIYGSGVWTLAHDDSSRTWDLWKTSTTSRGPDGIYRPDRCLVSFRGTQLNGAGEWDVLIDITSTTLADAILEYEVGWVGYGYSIYQPTIGAGFSSRMRNQRSKIFYKLLENRCANTVVTGHSLGGAMAQIFAAELHSAWSTTGDGGYLTNKLNAGANFVSPFDRSKSLALNRRTQQALHLESMDAWNPIRFGNYFNFLYYNTGAMQGHPLGYALPVTNVYCRRNDLALTYGKLGWRNVGSDEDQLGCDNWADAVNTGGTYAAKRSNHAIRNWFGLAAR